MKHKSQFPSEEWFKEWLKKFGRTSEEVERERELANIESDEFIQKSNIASRIENEEQITVRCSEENFPKSGTIGFAYTMDKLGKMFSNTQDIEVRYSKPEDEMGNIVPEVVVSNLPLIKLNKEQDKLQKQNKK